jgi:hypothetical protein
MDHPEHNEHFADQPLHEVTPGLDRFERVRLAALRALVLTRAIGRDVAAVIDKGVAAASEEAKLAWQRWSPPKTEAPPEGPPASQAAPDAPPADVPPSDVPPSGASG